jgi:hypothetical protein
VGKGDQPTDKQCDSDAIASTRTRRVRRQRSRMHPSRPWMWAKVDGSWARAEELGPGGESLARVSACCVSDTRRGSLPRVAHLLFRLVLASVTTAGATDHPDAGKNATGTSHVAAWRWHMRRRMQWRDPPNNRRPSPRGGAPTSHSSAMARVPVSAQETTVRKHGQRAGRHVRTRASWTNQMGGLQATLASALHHQNLQC